MANNEHNEILAEETELSGYRLLQNIQRSSQLASYRAIREADDTAVIVKMSTSSASAQTVAQLEREFGLTRNTEDAGIFRHRSRAD